MEQCAGTPLLETASAISSESCLETVRLLERLAFFCDLFCRQGGPRGDVISSSFEAASESLRRAPESCACCASGVKARHMVTLCPCQ